MQQSTVTKTTVFAYDEEGHLIGEYTGAGTMIQEIVWFEGLPVASLRPAAGGGIEIFNISADHLGTPRVIRRATDGVVVWRWDSDPFGNGAPNENPSGLGAFSFNLRFPGQYADAETGLNYNYFRDYNPKTGRYVQSDPIGLRGGTNSYGYAHNNALSYVDPNGLEVKVVATNPAAAKILMAAYAKITSTKEGAAMCEPLEKSSDIYLIKPIVKDAYYCAVGVRAPQCVGNDRTVFIDPFNNIFLPTTAGMQETPKAVVLGHELGHARGELDNGDRGMNNVNRFENPLREALKVPKRTAYYTDPPIIWVPGTK